MSNFDATAKVSADIVLIGGGGHARSLVDVLGLEHIAGYVSPQPAEAMNPLKWLGNDDTFISESEAADRTTSVHITLISGHDGNMLPRRKVIEIYKGFRHPAVVATDATISSTAHIADGCAVMHRAYLGPGAAIGTFSVINTGAIIEHDVHIGTNTFVGPGAVICGGVSIGDDCYIGAGAKIRNGVTIVGRTVIGMGAIVSNDIKHSGTYVGCPARPLDKK